MNLQSYLRILTRYWVLLLTAVLVGTAAASAASLVQPRLYTSSAKVFVSTGSAANATDLSQGNSYTQQIVASYADVATTPFVLSHVLDDLGLDESAAELAARVSVTTPTDTSVIDVAASDTSPVRAAAIANSVAVHLANAVSDLAPSASNAAGAVKLTQVQQATPSQTPFTPRIALNLALGAVLGLVLGLIAITIWRAVDTRVRSAADVESLSDRPVLGGVLHDPDARTRPLVVREASHGPRAEAFRGLRTNLRFVQSEGSQQTITVTSSIAGEGKSTSAANLAITLAEAGTKTLLIDADLRRPRIAHYLGIENDLGLVDLIIGRATQEQVIQLWGEVGLSVLPAGPVPPNPSELLQSSAMNTLIASLQDQFDVIIFDAPPLLPVSDAALLTKRSSGALLVCAANKVRVPQVQASLAALSKVDAHLLGFVVTMLPRRGLGSYSYGYDYGRGYDIDAR